jgi:hypothetical protein
MPETMQADLLRALGEDGAFLLIGEGITDPGLGRRLRDGLPAAGARFSAVVPAAFPLEVYAALIDHCDLFISGDTGPLHIAAARKRTKDGPERFVNRTAVFSVFGATPPRMSGYDDLRPGFLPSGQDAPSVTFISGSPCRNATCVNKMLKTCSPPRCFASLDVLAIASRARSILGNDRRNSGAA